MTNKTFVEIDGAMFEGGGQTFRTACSLSVITKKPCRIFNIRKNRPEPGLAAQHLLGVQALSKLCGGRLEGDALGSTEITFWPEEIKEEKISLHITTASSITLILQMLIPPSLFSASPVVFSFQGGATNTFFSPSFDYFRSVFLKTIEKMGAAVDINITNHGYYPEGGAAMETKIYPATLKNINITERGNLQKILIISGADESLKNKNIAERQLFGAKEILGKFGLPCEERAEYYPTQCPGNQIFLAALFENTVIGVDNLGKMGKRAEDVGKEAALELLKEEKSQDCIDKHLADQILLYMALAPKTSQVTVSEVTSHCKTNMRVIEKFLDGAFDVKNNSISWRPKS